ncbi:hypothetical protein CBR_g41758 [Chara braunii]|uniref:Uncharacterized protein n=1 Tax=Chara braunii TaxID=69332 RepID=A0A388LWP7_CHABU|nr:hypothetical protein CBR_g41758 [Chara braunii]|eukprot:GBG86695.1 hypothetical protein CBR_g41758 [Chara braunii]
MFAYRLYHIPRSSRRLSPGDSCRSTVPVKPSRDFACGRDRPSSADDQHQTWVGCDGHGGNGDGDGEGEGGNGDGEGEGDGGDGDGDGEGGGCWGVMMEVGDDDDDGYGDGDGKGGHWVMAMMVMVKVVGDGDDGYGDDGDRDYGDCDGEGAASMAILSVSSQSLGTNKVHASGAEDNTTAERVLAEGPSPLKLRQVHVFFRHGDRAPVSIPGQVSAETTKLWESRIQPQSEWMEQRSYVHGETKPFGQLTRKGAQQARELGQVLRERYGELLDLPAEQAEQGDNTEWIRLRSTDFRRTHMTGFYVLSGLLGSEREAGKLKFEIRGPREETLCVHTDDCPKLSAVWKRAWKVVCGATEVDSTVCEGGWRPHFQRQKAIIAAFLGVPPSENFRWLLAIDCMNCRFAHGDPLPDGLSIDDLEEIRDFVVKEHVQCLGFEELRPFFGGRMLTELHGAMKEVVEHSRKSEPVSPRLALYSVHDITLLPLLTYIGAPVRAWPPYAGALCFELWSTPDGHSHFVRVLYNWKEVALPTETSKEARAANQHPANGRYADPEREGAEASKEARATNQHPANGRYTDPEREGADDEESVRATVLTWKSFCNLLDKHTLLNTDFDHLCELLPDFRSPSPLKL